MLRDDGLTERLCSRCAVIYAQQGCKVERIQEGTPHLTLDDVRKKQTDSFIQQLADTKLQVEDAHVELLRTEALIKTFYNDQYTLVVKTFSDVEKALQIVRLSP